jgi:hypothetical protein
MALCAHGDDGEAVSARENEAIRADILAMQETLAALDQRLAAMRGEGKR